jgi:hypothetical protein
MVLWWIGGIYFAIVLAGIAWLLLMTPKDAARDRKMGMLIAAGLLPSALFGLAHLLGFAGGGFGLADFASIVIFGIVVAGVVYQNVGKA